jgi:hypothetical protein
MQSGRMHTLHIPDAHVYIPASQVTSCYIHTSQFSMQFLPGRQSQMRVQARPLRSRKSVLSSSENAKRAQNAWLCAAVVRKASCGVRGRIGLANPQPNPTPAGVHKKPGKRRLPVATAPAAREGRLEGHMYSCHANKAFPISHIIEWN